MSEWKKRGSNGAVCKQSQSGPREWHIINPDWAEMMCELAKSQTKPHNTEIMLPDNLPHVVMELDKQSEKGWFEGEKGETLNFEKIFWTENMCAASVSLKEKQFPFFLMLEAVPHLSLSKAKEQTWAEGGGVVKTSQVTYVTMVPRGNETLRRTRFKGTPSAISSSESYV